MSIPIRLHLALGTADDILADDTAKQQGKCALHALRVGAGKIDRGDDCMHKSNPLIRLIREWSGAGDLLTRGRISADEGYVVVACDWLSFNMAFLRISLSLKKFGWPDWRVAYQAASGRNGVRMVSAAAYGCSAPSKSHNTNLAAMNTKGVQKTPAAIS